MPGSLLSRVKRVVGRLRRRAHPISAHQLTEAIQQLAGQPTELLFVHSSLSSCGYIQGGPATVIESLRRLASTLVLPTHTYCYPNAGTDVGPVFDPTQTPSVVGAISDWFWRQAGVVRSLHPTHSVAAVGNLALDICSNHQQCDTPCGSETPYERLLQLRSAVLMFGCTLNTYTLFHTTEHIASCPYLYYPQLVTLRYRDPTGEIKQMKMWRQNMEYARRFEAMDLELAHEQLLITRQFRDGKLLFVPDASAVHSYLMHRMQTNPNYLLRDS